MPAVCRAHGQVFWKRPRGSTCGVLAPGRQAGALEGAECWVAIQTQGSGEKGERTLWSGSVLKETLLGPSFGANGLGFDLQGTPEGPLLIPPTSIPPPKAPGRLRGSTVTPQSLAQGLPTPITLPPGHPPWTPSHLSHTLRNPTTLWSPPQGPHSSIDCPKDSTLPQ